MKLKTFSVKAVLFTVAALMLGIAANAQNKVSGTVKGVDGEGLPGVTVMVKGTTTGASTDLDGRYSFSYSQKNPTLIVSCIGYETKEIAVEGKSVIDVVLAEETTTLDETVVVGYAVGNKRTITGAVERVTADNMNTGYVSNAVDAISGKVPGLVISQNGGNVTDTPTLRIRGTSSLSGGSEPLVIVDGVFGSIGMLYSLAPEDIKEISVLKDASETAQYGSRGSAGVIVVTTTRGKDGHGEVSYRGQFGVSTAYKNLDVLSADEWRNTNKNMFGGTGIDKGCNTNWIDWIQNKVALQNNHHISFSNGNKNSTMLASIGVNDRKGIVRNTGRTNYVARLAASHKAFDGRLVLELNTVASLTKADLVSPSIFAGAATYNPTYPAERNAEGERVYDPNAETVTHPADFLDYTRKSETGRVVLGGRATYEILKGFKASVFGSFNYDNTLLREYYPYNVKDYRVKRGQADASTSRNTNGMASAQLSFDRTFGKHAINALALAEAQRYNTWYDYAAVSGFESNYFLYNEFKAGSTVKYGDVDSDATSYTLMSYLVRLNYMFDNRFVVTLNARADGSSKLGANHKWGFFPSASAAWIISNENFMKGQSVVNNLKLRAGYGVTGNQDAITPYRSLKLMSPNGTTTYNGQAVTTYALDSNPNPDLKWETKYTFDAGVDFAMWKDRFSGTLDVYFSTTKDLLYTYTVPVPPFVYTTLLANMGTMTNNGVELALRGAIVETKDWGFTLSANAAYNQNKLVSLSGTYNGQELTTPKYIALSSASCNGLTSNTNVVYMTEGQPLNIFRLPVHDGFNVDEQGHKTYKFKDVNEDGSITLDDEGDREQMGQATPKVTANLTAQLRFKSFDLSTQLSGAFGHMIYNFQGNRLSNLGAFPTYNVLRTAPELGVYNAQHTSYWLEKGDFVNIQYITLGYNLPCNNLNLKYLKSFRVALACNNVATITGYKGMTPILNNQSLGGGIDQNIFPIMRTYTLQLSVRF